MERDLLKEALEWWEVMDDDDLESYNELPQYMQNRINRFVFYAKKYSEMRKRCAYNDCCGPLKNKLEEPNIITRE